MPSSLPLDDIPEALPKHERLRACLIRQVRDGQLQPGDALPTEHELAASSQMSRNTVRQALAGLERIGLISRVRGRGTFVHEDALHRLKTDQTPDSLNLFALVTPDTRGGFYPSLQRGFGEASGDLHNQVLVCDTGNDPFRQADALLQLMDKKVAGVAMVPTTTTPAPAYQIRPLRERGIPLVFCHRRVEGIRAPLVSFSGLEVGRMAGRALVEHGHRRVAMFLPFRERLVHQYEQGLREILDEGGAELPSEFVRADDMGLTTAERDSRLPAHLDAVLRHPSPPSAIFCSFDTEAELLYLLLEKRGVKVPGDISLVGFGGAWREGAVTRRLVSVTVDEEALGRRAVRLLQEMREGERPLHDETEILLPLSLSEGETLA